MSNFKEIKELKFWCQKVLPLVYEDSISYYELLGKVIKKLNDLIENNSNLPKWIQELIESYISSGAIGDVVNDILVNFMLNVKNPPNNLPKAIGDGTVDDTLAIQGCIDYANSKGGGCVYIPNGVYLTKSLVLYDNVSLFGFDRYSARLVLRGGATTSLIRGNVTNTSITGLTLDGNMDVQVNNINLIDMTAEELNLQNLLLTDGYILVNATVNKSMQISNVIFDYAVVKHMNLSGSGNILGSNLYLHGISAIKGQNLVTLNNSNSVLSNIYSDGETPVAFVINGNDNSVSGSVKNAVIPFQDNGTNNTIINSGKTEQLKITGNRTNTVGGNEVNHITGKFEVNALDIILNPSNPLTYKTPTLLNKFFKKVTFKDSDGVQYDVLVKGNVDLEQTIADVDNRIIDETTAREDADEVLSNKITTEKTDRENADTTLNEKINTEKIDREQAITDLNASMGRIYLQETAPTSNLNSNTIWYEINGEVSTGGSGNYWFEPIE